MKEMNIPVGVSDFEEIRKNGYARVAIFEAKYTKVLENLESECDTALQQIDDRMYAKEYEDDYDQILCYGISFFKKRCMVKKK